MSWGMASRGIVFPDGRQRNNMRKMCRLLFPADEVRAGLVCAKKTLFPSVPLCPYPLLWWFQSHPRGWWFVSSWGLQLGVRVLQLQRGGQQRGLLLWPD